MKRKVKRAWILFNNMQTMKRKVEMARILFNHLQVRKNTADNHSGSDPGMQICKTYAEEVLLLKPTR